MCHLISKILKRLENLLKTHKIVKSSNLVITMLENGVSIHTISEVFKINISSLSDLVKIMINKKGTKTYEYIHLKMSLEYQSNKSCISQEIMKNFLYSVLLLVVSTLMLTFYLFGFYPIIQDMVVDFGLATTSLSIQKTMATLYLFIVVVFLLMIVALAFVYRLFPDISKLLLLKSSKLCRNITTSLTLNQYVIAYAFSSSHDETIRSIRHLHPQGLINLQSQHFDANVKKGSLIFQAPKSWMIDSYLSMITLGLEQINVNEIVRMYQALAKDQRSALIKRYATYIKIVAIICVGFVIYIFYSSLMMPLNAMEVL